MNECALCGTRFEPDSDNPHHPEYCGKQCHYRYVDAKDQLEGANLPERQKLLEDVEPIPAIQSFLRRDYPRLDNGLLLYGPTEAGKTTQACAGLRWWGRKVAGEHDGPPLYVNMANLIESWRPNRNTRHTLDDLKAAGLLVLDDLGKANPSEWVAERLYCVFNVRVDSCRPTILTANAPLEDLQEYPAYNPETFRRLRDMVPTDDHRIYLEGRWWA